MARENDRTTTNKITNSRVCLAGLPGAGKGTIFHRLAQYLGQKAGLNGPVPQLSARAMLMQPPDTLVKMGISRKDAEGVRATIHAGIMVEDHIVEVVLRAHFDQPQLQDNWLAEGVPRLPSQVKFFENRINRPTAIVILVADKAELRRRANDRFVDEHDEPFSVSLHNIDPKDPRHPITQAPLRHRPDDDRERLEVRFAEYEHYVVPTIAAYRQVRRPDLRIVEIDTTVLTPDETFQRIVRHLYG